MSTEQVFAFAKRMTDSIICLRDGGHHLQAAMLTYVAIEQMAWLSVEPLRSGPSDFQHWVSSYMLPNCVLPCTAREIWEARNGLLHMGTAESSANRDSNEIRLVCYVYGSTPKLASNTEGVVFLRVEDLVTSYLTGVLWFLTHLDSNTSDLQVAEDKIARMLTQRPLNAKVS
ncbi:hypothetical protein ALQ72_02677 [Pseudomonas syringae pv. maculicola]|uniref:hypothetical protein n=1 Tax=Pseudomonas syringae group genomosp. 3 TaxID=251701 RepID=UPI0006B89BEF|nr:hypothetical protein [Pseudomonas syringae group genomosp. 3]MBM0209876.1 hypothetical protein [Pseudomonas syringae pv. maculicola]RMM78398.1 hypothetical protein ALQ72_02677 [Pseudomonas syringae pv. maculicola]